MNQLFIITLHASIVYLLSLVIFANPSDPSTLHVPNPLIARINTHSLFVSSIHVSLYLSIHTQLIPYLNTSRRSIFLPALIPLLPPSYFAIPAPTAIPFHRLAPASSAPSSSAPSKNPPHLGLYARI